MIILFDVTQFRIEYPSFASPILYPDERLQYYFDLATCYISNEVCGTLSEMCRRQALYLMTAHLAKINDLNSSNEIGSLTQSATVGQVSVSLTPPTIPNQWQWWLNTTNYGQQLLALLKANAVGGWTIGGLPERSAFRKVGGIF